MNEATQADDVQDNLVHLFGGAIDAGPPPIDCRMRYAGRGVIVSQGTAVIMLAAVREMQARGGFRADGRKAAMMLCEAFDECDLVERDVAPDFINGMDGG